MRSAVLKFGGSSLSNSKKILFVANRISELLRDYRKILVVLSAPADVTDNLISISKNIADSDPSPNILQVGEILSIGLMELALKSKGIRAIALNHYQLNIKAKKKREDVELLSVDLAKIKNIFSKYDVIIIPGFIACDDEFKTILLGRGGSDYTSTFMADVLKSPCFLFSDVKGIYSSNPSYIEDTRKVEMISYDEVINIIKYASQIRHTKAIEFAAKRNIELHLGSTFHPEEKTTKIINDKSDMRIKYIDIKTDGENTTLYVIGNHIEQRIDVHKIISHLIPNSTIKAKKDILQIILKRKTISKDEFKRIHNLLIFR